MTDITYSEWMNLSKKRFHSRTKELKDVDTAFKAFEDGNKRAADLQELAKKFQIWVALKGAGKHDLMHSIRNRKVDADGFGPVERLQSLIRSSSVSNVAVVRDLNREVHDRLVMDPSLSSTLFDRNKVSETYNRSKLAVSNALAAVLKTGSPGPERTRYIKWFGAYDEARKKTVLANFRNLNSLFTSGVIIVKDARTLVGAWGDCFGFAMPGNKQNYVEFSVGRAFFLKQGYNVLPGATPAERSSAVKIALAQAYANTSDWTVGTMIHELGHAINNLPDVNFQAPGTYRIHPGMTPDGWTQVSTPDLDMALAIADPDLAVENTDNYGQFARESL